MGGKSGILLNPLICKKWPLCWCSNAADLLIYEQLTFNVCISKYGLRIEMHSKVTYLKYYKTLLISCFWADWVVRAVLKFW